MFPPDPVHPATGRAVAAILPAPWPGPRCFRSLSAAPPLSDGSPSNIVSLPPPVPFLQCASNLTVSILGFTPNPWLGATCFYSRRSKQLNYVSTTRLDRAHEVDRAHVTCMANRNVKM